MPAFAELRPLIGHLPNDPLSNFVFSACVLREETAFLFREVHHDRTRFEDADRRAAALRRMVDQHRHAMVGIDFQKVRLELIAAPDIAGDDLVVETELFEQNRNLLAVWRRPKVEIEHRCFLSAGYDFAGCAELRSPALSSRVKPLSHAPPARMLSRRGVLARRPFRRSLWSVRSCWSR